MPSILFGDNQNRLVARNPRGKGPMLGGTGFLRNPMDIVAGQQNKNNQPTTHYGGGSGRSGSTSSSDIQNAYNDELIKARDAELAALEARLQSSIDLYNQQLNQIKANYEGLRDQSEVDRYKSRRALREALANRGQLDSGYGRQEALNADLNYSNQLNAINLQEAQANQEVQNQINQLKADNLANKANIRARYAEALRQ